MKNFKHSLIAVIAVAMISSLAVAPVSYTHLDVYKRQIRFFLTARHIQCILSVYTAV